MLLKDKSFATTLIQTQLEQPNQIYTYRQGEMISTDESGFWQVYRGVVQLNKIDFNGNEVVVGWALPNTCFGRGWQHQLPEYEAYSLSEVYLRWCSLSEIESNCNLARHLIAQQSKRLIISESLLSIIGIRKVEERLWQLLLLLQAEMGVETAQGKRINLRFTHQNLATMICTTRVTVTRVLGVFQNRGWVKIDGDRHIIITHPTPLQQS